MKRLCVKLSALLMSILLVFAMAPATLAAEYTYPVSGGAELEFDPLTGTITAVKNPSKLTSVDIPSEIYNIPVTAIGDNAFSYCRNLIHITLPSSIKTIGEDAFFACKSLLSIEIPNGVTSIGDSAFSGCTKLESVTIPGSIKSLTSEFIFSRCESLSQINLSEGIEVISPYVFFDCDSITEIIFPNSLTEITAARTGIKLANTKKITFGKNLRIIGNDAFKLSDNLEAVYFTGNAPIIGSDVFSTDNNLVIYYPSNASGWSTPVWNGYVAQPYIPAETESPAPNPTPTTDPEEIAPANPGQSTSGTVSFKDVAATAYYFDPVQWAVKNNITLGTTATTFSPNQTCTKAQIITFLWRAVGSPNPNIENQYVDVSSSDFYYKAALWAYEKGLQTEWTFNGNEPCTRGQTVTYLWILAGMPSGSQSSSKFTDISPLSTLRDAVSWANDNKIAYGTSATTFSPNSTCTRGQIVTFLYRAMA